MIIFSWNIRGVGARIKRRTLRKFLNLHDPWIVFIQESKLELLTPRAAKSLWNWDDIEYCVSPSQGNSGGLITLWRNPHFQLDSFREERNWIAIKGVLTPANFNCTMINIYNSCEASIRESTWTEIVDYCSNSQYPCLIAGDFNETLTPGDRGSKVIDHSSSAHFQSFISDLHLIEIMPSEGWFTWFRGSSMSKLDRFFVQSEWITKFPLLNTSILKRSISDHCPIILKSREKLGGPKPFRFQDAWLTNRGCLETVKKAWLNSDGLEIMEKLKRVKIELKEWNSQVFGNIDQRIASLEGEIQKWDNIARRRLLSDDEIKSRASSQLDLWNWLKKQEIYWAQNSRIQWLKEGDRNSKFFHTFASLRRNKNNISSLEMDGRKIENPEEIRAEAVNYFSKLFHDDSPIRPVFQDLDFKSLNPSQAAELIVPFSHLEVDQAVASCNSSKSPGPDGFNFSFIKASWETIKYDVYTVIQEFWETGTLPKGCNVALVALIPKIPSPEGFKDYRPISMVGCIYKIVAKILAGRLKKVMGYLVGPNQSSFIEERQILDSVLIAGEIIETCKKSKKAAILLKLDFQKAFDSVSWPFLAWTLERMGFPPRWILWITSCVSSAAASILVNGTPSKPFKLQRGLRQGDPLSPFLFVFAAEVMNLMIKKAVSMNLWTGVDVSKNGPNITHLQFADDTLLFAPSDRQSLKNIKMVLILFQLTSGLKINFHKSEILGVHVAESTLRDWAQILRCKVGRFPMTYLGLPLGGSTSRVACWEPLLTRMNNKLAAWKSKLLSIGGRLTLIKASLSNLPMYFMSLYPIPKSVIEKIISIQRRFLWNGKPDQKAQALVRWEIVQLPKSLGGLNVGNVLNRNLGLLFKWVWRFFHEQDSLWRQVIQAKYNYSSSFCICDLTSLKNGGPWKQICNSLLKHPEACKLVQSGTRKQVGDGEATYFWHDVWIQDKPLKTTFPRLFRKAYLPHATVAAMRSRVNGEWDWKIPWNSPLRPRDQADWNSLLELLESLSLKDDQKDRLVWLLDKSESFTVNSFYLEISRKLQPLLQDTSHKLWKGLVPFRIEIFFWLVLLGKINTKVKLASHNIIPLSDLSCSLCNINPEDTSHLFLHCPFAQSLWNWWCSLWGISWVWPFSIEAAYTQWKFPTKNKFFQKIWNAAFQVIIWALWKERNSRVFNNTSNSIQEVQNLVLLRISWWSKGWKESFPYSANEVLRNPWCLLWHSSHKSSSNSIQKGTLPTNSLKWITGVSRNAIHNNMVMGGALLNNEGKILCVFSCPLPLMEASSAEVLAIHRTIQISLSNNRFRNNPMEIESQSQEAVVWCNNSSGGPWNLQFILNFIRSAARKGIKHSIILKNPNSFSTDEVIARMDLYRNSEFVVWVN